MEKTNEELILLSGRDKLKRKKPVRFLIAYVVSVLCITLAASMALVFGQTPATISSIFNISIEQTAGGQIISEDENLATTKEIVNAGENKSFIIAPDEGYYVTKLVIDGVSYDVLNYGQSFNYVFEKVNSEHSILATFEQKSFGRITVTQSDNGAITPESISINYGDSQEFTITPNEGYEITNITIDGQPVAITVNSGEAQKYSFNDIQADHTITATFSIRVFAITVNQSENGTISPSNSVVNYGSNQTFTITPDEGYKITSILIDYGTQNAKYINITAAEGDSQSFTFEDINNAHSITATFGIRVYSVYLTPPSNGTINPGNLYQSYSYGTSLSFTITPKENYRIERIIVNGIDIDVTSEQGESQIYTIDGITRNMQIAVIFGLKNYTVTFIDYDNTILSVQEVDHFGSAVPPTITREGYRFTGWDQSYKGITENKTLTAQYVKQWTVTFIDWNGDLLKTQTVDQGTNASAPESNPRRLYDDQYFYIFSGWDKSYNNVTSDLIVAAQYSSILRSFTIEFLGINGKVSTKIENVVYGTKITPPANPTKTDVKYIYTFQGWEMQGQSGVIYTYEDIEQLSITRSIIFAPKFSELIKTFTVEFRDIDGSTITVNGENIQIVTYGEDAIAPSDPIPPEGKIEFTGWDYGYTYVTRDLIITATYDDPSVKFRVDFENYNGIKVGSEDVSINSSLSSLQIPVAGKIGYKLTGWKIKDGDGTNYTSNDLLSYKVIKAITFVAQFDELIEYEITYYSKDTNGELVLLETTNPSSYNIESAESITLENPVRNGYKFLGWTCPYPDGNFNNPLSSVTIPANSFGYRNYVANWEVINFSIEYDFNGGDELYPNPTSYNVESNSITLVKPSIRIGYTFLGWTGTDLPENVDENGFYTLKVTIPTGSYGDRKYTANWEVITYSIYTIIDGETTLYRTFTIKDLEELGPITLENPVKLGYSFDGWSGTGLRTITLNVTINTLGDKEYTAFFSLIKYKITFDLDGGHFKSGSYPKTSEFTIETSVDGLIKNSLGDTIPVWKTRYTFLGWTCVCADYPEFSFNEPQKEISIGLEDYGNRTYIAQWAEQLEVRFFDDDGNIIQVEGQDFQYIDKGFAGVTAPDAVVKEHHTFLGWTIQGGDENVTYTLEQVEAMLITDNITFIAKSEPQKEVRFFDDDGNIIQVEGQDVQYVDNEFVGVIVPDPVVKEYHTFLGWTIQGGDENVTYTLEQVEAMLITDNITFIAKSEPQKEVRFFDDDGNIIQVEGQDVQYVDNEFVGVIVPDPVVKEHHTFLGWTIQGGDENVTYTLEQVEAMLITDNITFVAKSEPIEYEITYDLNDNDTGEAYFEGEYPVSYNTTIEISLVEPIRAGHRFLGWTGEGLTNPTLEVVIPKGSNGDKTYTAEWIEQFTVRFVDYDGTTNLSTQVVDEGSFAIAPEEDPTRAGYVFFGWTVEGGDGTIYFSREVDIGIEGSYISEFAIMQNTIFKAYYINAHTVTFEYPDEVEVYVDGIKIDKKSPLEFDVGHGMPLKSKKSEVPQILSIEGHTSGWIIEGDESETFYTHEDVLKLGIEDGITFIHRQTPTFNIVVTQSKKGTISPSDTKVYINNNQEFVITPDVGYKISSIIVDGIEIPVTALETESQIYTFENVQADHTITATFAIRTFAITTSSDQGATITRSAIVNYGQNVTFRISANTGYKIAKIIIDGTSIHIGSQTAYSHTFSRVSSSHSIVVKTDSIYWEWEFFNGGYYITKVPVGSGKLTIPSSFNTSDIQIKGIGTGTPIKNIDSYSEIVISNGIEVISNSAFNNNVNLTTITIPKSIRNIGEKAFLNCCNLANISFDYDSQLTSIGASAFESCSSLTSIIIPASLRSIENKTFYDCKKLNEIAFRNIAQSQLTSIGASSFEGCSKLGSITIPASVTSIGNRAFWFCYYLRTLTFKDNSQLKSIGDSAFSGCSYLSKPTIPASVISIGNLAFSGCSFFGGGITIPANVRTIGSGVFQGCSSLASINVDSNNAFYSSLDGVLFNKNKTILIYYPAGKTNTSYSIPSSVTSIGAKAFYYSNKLTSIIVPNSVTSIDYSAFYHCNSLNSIILPFIGGTYNNNFGYIFGAHSYYDNSNYVPVSLKTVIITGTVGPAIGDYAFAYCSKLTSITIPASVRSIGASAFESCSSLTTVIFEGNSQLRIIEEYAFYNCSKLTSITIPDSVTSIEEDAFYKCSKLTSITIPDSVTSIGRNAFNVTAWYNAQPNGVVYAGKVVYYYKGTMPENTVITLLDGTKTISYSAFKNCTNLKRINIPSSVEFIEDDAFYNCKSLIEARIPGHLASIGNSAFAYCSKLTSITIPASVAIIGDYAFYKCLLLTSINVDSNNLYYSSSDGILFNKNKTVLIFYPAAKPYYTSYSIPLSVTSIGDYAFYYCLRLKSITIPASVTSIGFGAFSQCYDLRSITINATVPPSLVTNIFDVYTIPPAITVIYVPGGSVNAYKTASGWSAYASKIFAIGS